MSKKLLSLILALALVLAMSATAMADYYTGLLPAVRTQVTPAAIIPDVHACLRTSIRLSFLKKVLVTSENRTMNRISTISTPPYPENRLRNALDFLLSFFISAVRLP